MAAMRIGGLASGMDIDSLVEKLMQAERAPLDKLEQKKQTYEWQRDAYRDVNTKLQTLDTYIADNLIIKSLNTKTATSSNSDKVGVIATSSATGTLAIEGVSQLAIAARAVGNQVSAIGTTKMKDLLGDIVSNNGTFSIELKAIQNNGEMPDTATKIEFTGDMTVNQFVSKVNSSNAGVNLVFENGRFSMTAKYTGDNKAGDEIEIEKDSEDIFSRLGFLFKDIENGDTSKKSIQTTDGKNAIFQVNGIATERSTNTFTISGYSITLKDTFNSIQTIVEKFKAAEKELALAETNKTNKKTLLDNAKTAYYGIDDTSENYTSKHDTAYKSAFGDTLSLSEQEIYNILGREFWKGLEEDSVEESFILGLTTTDVDVIRNAIHENEDLKDSKLSTLTDDQLTALSKVEDKNKIISFKEQADYDSLTKEQKAAKYPDKVVADNLKSKYNTLGDTFFKELQSDEIDIISENVISIENNFSNITNEDLKEKLKKLTKTQIEALNYLKEYDLGKFKNLATENDNRKEYLNAEAEYKAAETRLSNAESTKKTAEEDARDAKILNADGTINENADAIQFTKVEPAVTLTSSTNIDDIVTRIKEFVTTYNGLITELNNLTNETKYRDFQPLTSPQKEAMEEREIELWEKKAKSGLLRGDTIIKNGLSSLRSLIYQSNPAVSNSKYNTLYNIGITTSSNYLSGGTIEINEIKLRQALEEDPDAVTKLLSFSDGKEKDSMVINGVTKEVDTRGFVQKIRGEMNKIKLKIEERAGRSSMSETQYTLGKYLKDVDKSIESWKDKLTNLETRYWKQFTAMETMINKANQQYTSLSSYFA